MKYQIFNSDMIRKKVQINFVILEKPKYKIFSTEVNRKKVQIILVILCFSLVGAFILTLVNISHDLQVYSGIYSFEKILSSSGDPHILQRIHGSQAPAERAATSPSTEGFKTKIRNFHN